MVLYEESKIYAILTVAWIASVLQLSQNFLLRAAKNNV
jgi:hypothetical protein